MAPTPEAIAEDAFAPSRRLPAARPSAQMPRPTLERLGFETVATAYAFLDARE
jgi:hypothetical protein